jgi:hypothetical protein
MHFLKPYIFAFGNLTLSEPQENSGGASSREKQKRPMICNIPQTFHIKSSYIFYT